ncbi:MAG TPA: alpha-hydroxy-acid oxidizing protein [Trueperaceae bacterium]
MDAHDIAALDAYPLVPRVLHDVEAPDLSTSFGGGTLEWPLVARLPAGAPWAETLIRPTGATPDLMRMAAVDAAEVTAARLSEVPAGSVVAVMPPKRMADLVAECKRLADLGVGGVGIDLAPLAESAPFGKEQFRPRGREDLAELRAASGKPLWVLGVAGAADAEVAAEAGADVVVISSRLGARLRGPATIDVLPEVIDAVAGMLTVAAGGPARDGVDVFRYLAVGAELVVVEGERPLASVAAELAYAFKLTGCATLADVGYDALFAPLFGEP